MGGRLQAAECRQFSDSIGRKLSAISCVDVQAMRENASLAILDSPVSCQDFATVQAQQGWLTEFQTHCHSGVVGDPRWSRTFPDSALGNRLPPIAGQINSQSMTKIIAKDFASKYRDKREVFNFLSADVGKYF